MLGLLKMLNKKEIIKEFKNCVSSIFSKFAKENKFVLKQLNEDKFRMDTGTFYVNIYLGWGHIPDVNVTVMPKDSKKKNLEFGLGVICSYLKLGVDTSNEIKELCDIPEALDKYYDALAHHCISTLKEESFDWFRLESYVNKLLQEKQFKESKREELWKANRIREEAEEAFKNEKYFEAIKLYNKIKDHLTSAEIKKVAYCKSKIEK